MKQLYPAAIALLFIAATATASAQCGPTVVCPANITVNSTPGICGAVVNYAPATATTTCTGSTTIYSETFQSGVGAWTLNVNTGTNAATPNSWEVNATEGGVAPPGCGVANNGDLTLHITCTSAFCGSLITGAVYNAARTSNKRAESPVINTTGYSGLMLSFNYISVGDGLNDNASVVYNDGSGWQVLTASIKSTVCGNGQGQWTAYTATLPASCDNNPSLQIGFNWTNNNDNIGTDPSVAINDIAITTSGSPTPVIAYNYPSGTQFPVGTTTVTAIATDFQNNMDTCSFLVTVNDVELPVIDCPADITIAANNAGCTAIVSWTAAATDNCSVASLTSNYTSGSSFPLGTTTVTYNATDPSGNAATCSFNITVTNPAAVGITSAMSATVCEGSNDTLVASGASTYLWSTTSTNDSIFVVHSPAVTQWTVTGTDANGCTDSDTVTVMVSALLPVLVDLSAVDTNCVSSGPIDISAYATPAGGTWSGPGVSGTFIDPSVAGPGLHTLTYTVANADSCLSSGTGMVFIDNCLGMYSPGESSVKLYPNPNSGTFVLEIANEALVEIFSSTGQLVLSQSILPGKNTFSLEDAADGIYLLKVTQQEKVQVMRIVKEQ